MYSIEAVGNNRELIRSEGKTSQDGVRSRAEKGRHQLIRVILQLSTIRATPSFPPM